jgi:hypothetical protein
MMLVIWGKEQQQGPAADGTTGNFRMARMRDLPVGQNQPASGSFYSPPPAQRWGGVGGGGWLRKL